MNKQKKTQNDLIFIGALLAVTVLLGFAFFAFREAGDVAVVTVDGDTYGTYSLSKDTTVDIRTGEDDKQRNRLIIRDGKAFVELATCPDGICAAHKPISREGESIVCLPHKVVITIEKSAP